MEYDNKIDEKVSVIMGIYNIPTKDILKKSIESILNQTYKNIEFIIIDDGSTNNTYEWAKEIISDDDRVKLTKNEKNIGLTKTLNLCLKQASGKYIARMDGDDYCELDRIEKQIVFLKENKCDLVATNICNFDDDGVWGYRKNSEKICEKDFLFTSPIVHPTILCYKWCYEKVNGYNEKWYTNRNEDYDLFMRMYANGIRINTIQENLYYYREDEVCYAKRKYRYRICEFCVRMMDFKLLRLYPKCIPYIFKPLIVGLIPQKILRNLRKRYQ